MANIKILVGTQNPGKQQEYKDLLAEFPIHWLGPNDVGLGDFDADESGETFEENAKLKALDFARAANMPVLADDSGLAVDALDGAPGIYSARYAGPGASDVDRYLKLLDALKDIPEGARSARFTCVVALAFPDGTVYTAKGLFEGHIAFKAKGQHGFGYDPIFVLPDGRHLAEVPPHEKHAMSHRGLALEALRPTLLQVLDSLNQ